MNLSLELCHVSATSPKCFSREPCHVRKKCFSREWCHVSIRFSCEKDATSGRLLSRCFSREWCHVSMKNVCHENGASSAHDILARMVPCQYKKNFSRERCHVRISSPNNLLLRTTPHHHFLAKLLSREDGTCQHALARKLSRGNDATSSSLRKINLSWEAWHVSAFLRRC